MNRRNFLKNSTAATAGLTLPIGVAASPQKTIKKVIVVGAGLAGRTAPGNSLKPPTKYLY
ncbi:twin-arginine translocation signal domain-containing protein [Dyadobacter bucti]|uniref:twin-arginine translocation signal domain-containing protein n=1 Tax=Dyadobacter bucti TaxID=2572203 RepID=UPI0011095130